MVSMGEEPGREPDPSTGSVDRIVRRLGARRSLPPMEASSVPALGPPTAVAEEGREARVPPADIVLTPSRIYITLELPGASKETLEVTATNGHLSVHARGPDGREFHSEIELPAPVESEAVTATYRNGVLDVALPRLRGHRIRVRKGE